MGEVIRFSDHLYKWKQVFAIDAENATLQVYVNEGTGEVEVVQMNDDGKSIRTCLSTVDSVSLSESLSRAHARVGKK